MNQKGFTLIELLITSSLLVTGLLVVSGTLWKQNQSASGLRLQMQGRQTLFEMGSLLAIAPESFPYFVNSSGQGVTYVACFKDSGATNTNSAGSSGLIGVFSTTPGDQPTRVGGSSTPVCSSGIEAKIRRNPADPSQLYVQTLVLQSGEVNGVSRSYQSSSAFYQATTSMGISSSQTMSTTLPSAVSRPSVGTSLATWTPPPSSGGTTTSSSSSTSTTGTITTGTITTGTGTSTTGTKDTTSSDTGTTGKETTTTSTTGTRDTTTGTVSK